MAQQVRDVMTPDPVCVSIEDTTEAAGQRMRDANVGSLVVTENGGTANGIVTDRDIVVRGVADARHPEQTPVADVYSPNPTVLGPDEPIAEAVQRMRDLNVRRLPVVEADKVVGIVSLGDLAQAQDPNSVLGDISAAAPNN